MKETRCLTFGSISSEISKVSNNSLSWGRGSDTKGPTKTTENEFVCLFQEENIQTFSHLEHQIHMLCIILMIYIDEEEYNGKRKRPKSGDSPFSAQTELPSRKKRKSISSNISSRRDKLHCVCRTKYDPTKFYVGCDVCNEWVSYI